MNMPIANTGMAIAKQYRLSVRAASKVPSWRNWITATDAIPRKAPKVSLSSATPGRSRPPRGSSRLRRDVYEEAHEKDLAVHSSHPLYLVAASNEICHGARGEAPYDVRIKGLFTTSWNMNSANFAFWGFSEVAPGFVTPHTCTRYITRRG